MKNKPPASARPLAAGSPGIAAQTQPRYELTLYVAGSTAASARAIVNTRRFCEAHLAGAYTLEIIDISLQPQRIAPGQVLAVPTLVKSRPMPVRRFIGDMSQTDRLLRGFELAAGPAAPDGDDVRAARP